MGLLNPATTVLPLRDSLQGRDRDGLFSATVTGPVRYDDNGLIVEPGTTNYIHNPVGAVGTSGWSSIGSISVTAEPSLPGPLPGWLAGSITTGFRIEALTNQGVSSGMIFGGTTAALSGATVHSVMAWVWVPSAFSATTLQLRATNYAGATQSDENVDLSQRDQWQLVIASVTPVSGDLSGGLSVTVQGGTMLAGERFWVTCAAIQPEAVATSPAVGSMGPGYSWAGTPHASASVRAMTSPGTSADNRVDSVRGCVIARAKLHRDAGVNQQVVSVGANGTWDFLSLIGRHGVTDTTRFVSRVGAANERSVIGPVVPVEDRHTFYAAWDADGIGVAVDDGSLTTASRVETPGGAFAGGVAIGRLASSFPLNGSISDLTFYDASLSDQRRAIVLDALANDVPPDMLWGLFATEEEYEQRQRVLAAPLPGDSWDGE